MQKEFTMRCSPGALFPMMLALQVGFLTLSASLCSAQHAATLLRAASSDELPLPAWGPYSTRHLGPCCLVNRHLGQMFEFPIVISQQREEILLPSVAGKPTSLKPSTLLRRSRGLSPTDAALDDARPLDSHLAPDRNRIATLEEADKEGLLWEYDVPFLSRAPVQSVALTPSAEGTPMPVASWPPGEAIVDFFPAFTDPSGEGLLIRIALTNRSDRNSTYCIDLLGAAAAFKADFDPRNLSILPQIGGESLVLLHPQCKAVFALMTDTVPYAPQSCRVDERYFSRQGNVERHNEQGSLRPDAAPSSERPTHDTEPVSADPDPPHPNAYGLLRISDIHVEPGRTKTLFFSIGIGSDAPSALASARSLLSVVEDLSLKAGRTGAFSKALQAHHDAGYPSSDPAIRQLMAQLLGNIPLVNGRRLGTPSRRDGEAPAYDPLLGGMIALGWAGYEPLFAAAELNAFYHTERDIGLPDSNLKAVPPTNLLALWEVFQQTHSAALLARFYPSARRAYLEFLATGRQDSKDWLFRWPPRMTQTPDFAPFSLLPHTGPAADYASYVIRSAKILKAMAALLQKPAQEQEGYTHDLEETAQALNTRLWNPNTGVYGEAGQVAALFPLIAGVETVSPKRRLALLHALAPSIFGTRIGNEPAPMSPLFSWGAGWLFWKALIDVGEADTAAKLAARMLGSYRNRHDSLRKLPVAAVASSRSIPPEADKAQQDEPGEAAGLIEMEAAYHLPGTVTTGWNVAILDRQYNAPQNSLHCVFKNVEPDRNALLLCSLGNPGAAYTLTGALSGTVVADAFGVLTLTVPKDPTTQSLDIVPASVGKTLP